MMKLQKKKLILALRSVFYGILAYGISMIFLPLYTGGDQVYYCRFYEIASRSTLLESWITYQSVVGSKEPIYFLLVWVLSRIFSKTVVMSTINAVIASLVPIVCEKYKLNKIGVFAVFCGYYTFVLFLSAERLKLSMLFVVLAFVVNGQLRIVAALLSVLTHAQNLVLFLYPCIKRIGRHVVSMVQFKIKMGKKYELAALLMTIIVFFVLKEHVTKKILAYHHKSINMVEIIKPMIFLGLTFFELKQLKRNKEIIGFFVIVLLSTIVVGSSRLNIFCFYAYVYCATKSKSRLSIIYIITCLYYLVNGIFFLQRVLVFGNGF